MLAVFRQTSCQICALKHSNEKCLAPSLLGSPSLQGRKENNKDVLSQPHNQMARGMAATLHAFLCPSWIFTFSFLPAQRFFLYLRAIYNFIFFKIIMSISWEKVMHDGKQTKKKELPAPKVKEKTKKF